MAINSVSGKAIYTKHNVATTGYIYNESNGNAATSGWERVRANYIIVQFQAATMTDIPAMQYRIEGKFPTLDRPASIHAESVSAPFALDKLVEVSEHVNKIRVGVRLGRMVASPLSSPCTVYAGICLAEEE
jgi:hypothetical protein